MESTPKRKLLWLFLLSTIVWSALMGWEASGYYRVKLDTCPTLPQERGLSNRFASPIAALTITRSSTTFLSLIDQCESDNRLWNIHVAQTNTCMDFLFIALYGGSFFLFAGLLKSSYSFWLRFFISLTMAADTAENVSLLRSLHSVAYSAGEIHPPGLYSELKWVFFAVSLVLLGVLVTRTATTRSRWKLVMAVTVFLSGISILAGIFFIPLLTLAILLLGIALLVALVLYFPIQPFSISKLLRWVEVLYLLRFPIFGGLLLTAILPASYFAAPSIFMGLFDSLGFTSFLFVVWAALQLAWTVMITSQMIFVYGPQRYGTIGDLERSGGLPSISADPNQLSWQAVVSFGALALPTIIMTICGTQRVHWWSKLLGTLIASGLSLAVLWLTARIHVFIELHPGLSAKRLYPPFRVLSASDDDRRSRAGKLLDRAIDRSLPNDLKAGIIGGAGRLRSGHQLAATALVVLLVIYVALGFAFSPVSSLRPPAAIFFLLFLLNIFTWAFSGLAFLLDVLRVPVLTVALALSLVFGSLATDHTFHTDDLTVALTPPSPAEVINAWKSHRAQSTDAPIIIVATAGGGIRASAWTAEVLTGIADDCRQGDKNPFTSSLLLVSSVSGGSEGTMYVVGSYDPADGVLDARKLGDIRQASSRSALSAVGWGILYPDLLRTVPGVGSLSGGIFGHNVDRGWALENQWMKNWKRPPWSSASTLRDWTNDARNGFRPAVLFNGTVSETGQRLVVGTSALPTTADQAAWGSTALQFYRAYPNLDLPISTAARLSASFPWVSPMPRAEKGDLHFADGGYYDNSGVLSAGEWLLNAADALQKRRVLLVLIDASASDSSNPTAWSWQRQLVAPIGTLISVRTSSQQSRAALELALITNYLQARNVNVTSYPLSYPPDRMAPLSWHLTPEQQSQIGSAWAKPSADLETQRSQLYTALGCSNLSVQMPRR